MIQSRDLTFTVKWINLSWPWQTWRSTFHGCQPVLPPRCLQGLQQHTSGHHTTPRKSLLLKAIPSNGAHAANLSSCHQLGCKQLSWATIHMYYTNYHSCETGVCKLLLTLLLFWSPSPKSYLSAKCYDQSWVSGILVLTLHSKEK